MEIQKRPKYLLSGKKYPFNPLFFLFVYGKLYINTQDIITEKIHVFYRKMKRPSFTYIDMTKEELHGLIGEVERSNLSPQVRDKLTAIIKTIEYLLQVIEDKSIAIGRLVRMIFGTSTESSKNILGKTDEEDVPSEGSDGSPNQEEDKKKKPVKGHGRNGSSAYWGAEKIFISHSTLKAGFPCPLCVKGKVYKLKSPGTVVRFVGSPPLQATVYELEKLRCNLCGEVFTAELPKEAGDKKYDETAGAMIGLLKYGSGFPFYRFEKLQASLGIPVPASTQWEIVEEVAHQIYPVFEELKREAAQGEVVHNDDTTMKILDMMKNTEEQKRKGIFTTGIVSTIGTRKIGLFFTGRNHAGENMDDVLRKRDSELEPPIQMCDALSRNVPKTYKTILANCLVHGRRNFVDVEPYFPQECKYVIETLGKVYKNDETAKEQNMSPQERLKYHQAHSGPLMDALHQWLNKQFDEKKVEPNSSLGKAISYMLNHWEKLTRFLELPGVPLDNNVCEQALKKTVLHRKNSLFYKTERGAYIGDMFMSLIHTCNLNGENPFDYLTELQKHSAEVFKNPSAWMPWNYRDNL